MEKKKVLQTGRKHFGKMRNCSLRAISRFPTVFSRGLYCRHVKPELAWKRVKYVNFENNYRLYFVVAKIWQNLSKGQTKTWKFAKNNMLNVLKTKRERERGEGYHWLKHVLEAAFRTIILHWACGTCNTKYL